MGIAASSDASFRRLALLALAFCVLLAVPASRADAADGSLLGCGYAASNPFLRFLDPLPYTLAPDGGFEAGAAGLAALRWREGRRPGTSRSTLSGPGTKSLQLPAGSSARRARRCASGCSCRSSASSTQGGALLSSLKVEAVWTNAAGGQSSIVLLPGVLGGSGAWAPTLPLLQLGGALNALTLNGLTTQMSFRFTPKGGLLGSGTWRIDDVYVDPWKTI